MISTGKLHEYMGSRKPILALAPDGEVRKALSGYEAAWTVMPDDVGSTAKVLTVLLAKHAEGSLPAGDAAWIERYDRKRQAGDLSVFLASLVST